MRQIDALIFDFDGTLADSMWVWRQVDDDFMESHNLVITSEQSELLASLGFEGTAEYLRTIFDVHETTEELIDIWLDMALSMYAEEVQLKPGAHELLKTAKAAGLRLGIATSLQRKLLDPALVHNEVMDLFDVIVSCDEVCDTGKTTPLPYLVCSERLEVPLERCVVFEDVSVAAASAKAGGAYVVGIKDDNGHQRLDVLAQNADRVIDTFYQVMNEDGSLALL